MRFNYSQRARVEYRDMLVEMKVLVDEIFSIVRREIEVHARQSGINCLVRGVQEVQNLVRELRVGVLDIRRYAPQRVADGIAGAATRRPRIVIRPGFGCDQPGTSETNRGQIVGSR